MSNRVDELGDLIKSFESRETSRYFMKGIPIIARLDGKAFHTFTRGMDKPYDQKMCDLMDDVAKYLVEEFHAVVSYTQSDEITLVFYPYKDNPDTELPFGGRIFKFVSVLASSATAKFLSGAMNIWPDRCNNMLPRFDCRCFEVPDKETAVKALRWREIDATKNAVSMAARAYFSHKEVDGKTSAQM